MSVMMLAIESGSEVIIRALGRDENEAVEALSLLIDSGFDEE